MSFEYNDEGIRTSKTVNGVETVYYVNGGQIVAEKTGTRTIVYIYDALGTPIGMMYRTTSYAEGAFDVFWYEKNLQGDIVAVYNASGTKVATYTYSDAWGNHSVSYTNGGASTGAQYNPFRYRSYYYDTDLGMYYLQSRYYDAKICRFINADSALYHSMIGYNMFAYCENNPVNYIDYTGESAEAVAEAAKYFWWLIFVDGPLPIGDYIFFVIMGTVVVISVSELIRWVAENASDNDVDSGPDSLTDPDAKEIDDDAASLPQQGNVTSGVPGAPSVEAGKQGKHVPGHNNYEPDKSKWPNGKNGVRETQEAWKNSVPHPKKPNTRIGISNNGTKVEIKVAKTGIHGYPIFP